MDVLVLLFKYYLFFSQILMLSCWCNFVCFIIVDVVIKTDFFNLYSFFACVCVIVCLSVLLKPPQVKWPLITFTKMVCFPNTWDLFHMTNLMDNRIQS